LTGKFTLLLIGQKAFFVMNIPYCCVLIVGKLPAWLLNRIAQVAAPKVRYHHLLITSSY